MGQRRKRKTGGKRLVGIPSQLRWEAEGPFVYGSTNMLRNSATQHAGTRIVGCNKDKRISSQSSVLAETRGTDTGYLIATYLTKHEVNFPSSDGTLFPLRIRLSASLPPPIRSIRPSSDSRPSPLSAGTTAKRNKTQTGAETAWPYPRVPFSTVIHHYQPIHSVVSPSTSRFFRFLVQTPKYLLLRIPCSTTD
ncbi:hypothetical protein BDP81DRAFT_125680 [Colletotrichum phormii]|uniref:Uncharacterized protein n=1 Tax=Colletotrichum phormii TaxID=359342 RepID=A0AAI9ZZA0_9PEZI|nr:uncharacterized protein BDP81DRAFT_125680 [Colletotrichum phormii]KAK1640985.1 hypothetical protein BDP81DRAFT_125680 [Colletotrichum phormii]